MLIVEDAAVSNLSIPAGPACLDSNCSGHDIFSEDFTLRGPRIRSVQADSNRWITTGVNGEKILFRYRDWKYMLTQAPCTRSLLDASRLEDLKSDHPNLYWFYLNASAEDSALSTKSGHDDFRRHAGGVLYGDTFGHWFDAIESETETEISRLSARRGTIDIAQHLASMPLRCAFRALGLSEDAEVLSELQRRLADYVSCYAIENNSSLDPEQIHLSLRAADEHVAFFRSQIAPRIRASDSARLPGGAHASDEMMTNLFTLLAAVSSQILATLCFVIRSMLEHPTIFSELAERGPDAHHLLDNAAWELIRYENAGKGIIRFPVRTFEYRGQIFTKNSLIYLAVHAMDRDPKNFEKPDEIDITRENASKLPSFGTGRHACMGRLIAHKHASEMVKAMLSHWHSFGLARPSLWHVHTGQYLSRTLISADIEIL